MAASRDCPVWVAVCVAVVVVALVVAFIVVAMVNAAKIDPYMRYYVSVDSVSGLDLPPSKDLALDPRFNLTVRLASSSPGRSPVCVDPGMYLLVSHRCIPLATSAATTQQLCVGGAENSSSVSIPVIAKGAGMRLPGYMMDSLVADLRSGMETFEVRFMMSGDNFGDLKSCGFRRVGDVTAECEPGHICYDSQDEATSVPPPFIPPPIIMPPSRR